jgi:hypothetical protein
LSGNEIGSWCWMWRRGWQTCGLDWSVCLGGDSFGCVCFGCLDEKLYLFFVLVFVCLFECVTVDMHLQGECVVVRVAMCDAVGWWGNGWSCVSVVCPRVRRMLVCVVNHFFNFLFCSCVNCDVDDRSCLVDGI